jgi:hypothetical protein
VRPGAVARSTNRCENSSAAAGKDHDANEDDSYDDEEKRSRWPFVNIIGIGATRMVLFVWSHRPSPWPLSPGQRGRNAYVPFIEGVNRNQLCWRWIREFTQLAERTAAGIAGRRAAFSARAGASSHFDAVTHYS